MSNIFRTLLGLAPIAACFLAAGAQSSYSDELKAPEKTLSFKDSSTVAINTVEAAKVEVLPDGRLSLQVLKGSEWPGATLSRPNGTFWDFSDVKRMNVAVENNSSGAILFGIRISNANGDGSSNSITIRKRIEAGSTKTVSLPLNYFGGLLPKESAPLQMKGMPFNQGADLSKIAQIYIFSEFPQKNERFKISPPEVERFKAPKSFSKESFFPFIDEFGQFMHADWPGKIHTEADFAAVKEQEEKDIAAKPCPQGRDRFGGWADGPSLKATGSFRVEKWNGKWHLVDPDGKLFWSYGIDCVRADADLTPLTGRLEYFKKPAEEGLFARCVEEWTWAPSYMKDAPAQTKTKLYDYYMANLARKYGPDWQAAFNEMALKRLKSWGANTLGDWSADNICRSGETPYVIPLWIHSLAPRIEGALAKERVADPFAQEFRDNVAKACQKIAAPLAKDAFCIGFFAGNELNWNKKGDLAFSAVLQAPREQPAKQRFAELLKKKYGKIEKLNEAWKAGYASWDAFLDSSSAPTGSENIQDLRDLTTAFAEQYFAVCKEELKKAAPDKLFLGMRFPGGTDPCIAAAAAKHCDIVSYNVYVDDLESLKLPDGTGMHWCNIRTQPASLPSIDKPIMIGEFHFSALDRGSFSALVLKESQKERAEAFKNYMVSALKNPQIVGAHWFCYADQPTSGRFDGECYQTGFVGIADSPYKEMVDASRELGASLYKLRANANFQAKEL